MSVYEPWQGRSREGEVDCHCRITLTIPRSDSLRIANILSMYRAEKAWKYLDSGVAVGNTVVFETRIVTYKCPYFVKIRKGMYNC